MIDVSIDDPRTYNRLDPDDMYALIGQLPDQIERAWELASGITLPDALKSVRNVVITGMGGSAIGGSLVESYGAHDLPLPVSVWRNYGVPSFVDENTLIVGISFSGNTEETLSALRAARDRGAKILVITTGGQARDLAEKWNVPLLAFEYTSQPRAAIGYLVTPLLRILDRLGFLPPQEEAIREAVQVLRGGADAWGGHRPTSENRAKQIASDAAGKAVVIYGADYLSAVARRWKTQMNENAKNWSFFEEFPELDHNAIVGYGFPRALGDAIEVVMLDGPDLGERIRLRMQVTQELLDGFRVHWQTAEARGSGRLAQMLSLVTLGDYVSYYLALLNGTDPTSIAPINFLKNALARAETEWGVPSPAGG
jgi:glucose/mannose-6-phosphate isomerase